MRIAATALVILATALAASAQSSLKLVPRKNAEVELAYGKRSVIFDLDDALIGANGSLPGNPPHKYRTLFTAEKDGFVYLVANLRSASPISGPMAPCGGDSPQSILWIKADKALTKREVRSEIYESCSYNYFDSKFRMSKSGFVINYGGEKKLLLEYDNSQPEKALRVTKSE